MPPREPRLLIVDDEVDACRNLSDILSDLGYRVDVAFDGPGALDLVRQHHYDVALLDLKMPGMNGVELYKRIKAMSAGTVAIVVTAFATSGIAQEALDAGAAEVVAKPVDLQRLIRLVEDTLGQPLMMIVDDDPDLCQSLWDVLRGEGYRVCLAHDAPSAEQLLKAGGYRVVLIDMKLPVGSGAEVFELVRKTHAQARTVLITGFRSETDQEVERALAQGADSVVYKPFDVPQLLSVLKQLSSQNESLS
jgi:CheY-like chemotaxis protein